MNLLGWDVRGLDVDAFLETARTLYPLIALVWLAVALRLKRPGWLLLGILSANAYVWAVTNYPLQRVYALGPSSDRVNTMAMCQVVAAGNSPLRMPQVGQLHFEPFWSFFVAALSGWNNERVFQIFPFLPLIPLLGFGLSLYFGLRPAERSDAWTPWERVLIVAFATLLCTSPLDFAGTYRAPWAISFLLKPNHALGLALFPLVLMVISRIRSWPGRFGAGFLLHVMGWVFVLHMVYVSFGLVVFAGLSLLMGRTERRRDLLDVATVLGVNVLIVSPYLIMLVTGYPFTVPSVAQMISPWSPHLLETTLRIGWVFVLGLWGVWVAFRRLDRLSRLWVAQVVGAYLLWVALIALSALQLARERDELYYWIRFLIAASAGIGAWDLACRGLHWTKLAVWSPSRRAVAVLALALPWSLPYWWDPPRMDLYFSESLSPIPESLRGPTDFLRKHTDPRAVVAGDRWFARYVAALGARRVLLSERFHQPGDYEARRRVEAILVRSDDSVEVREAAGRYGVQYLTVTPGLLDQYLDVSLEGLRGRAHFEEVHFSEDVTGEFLAILRLRGQS